MNFYAYFYSKITALGATLLLLSWSTLALGQDSEEGTYTKEDPSYKVPEAAPLYEKNTPYGSFLKFPAYFALGAEVGVGRLESPGKTRNSGPARSLRADARYHLKLPSMNELSLGLEYATSSLKFSTGKLDVPITFSVKSSYDITVYNELKTGFTLALGRSYAHYYETVNNQEIRSDGLISGTAIRLSSQLTLGAYEFVHLKTGLAYTLYEYSIGKTVKQSKDPGKAQHPRKNNGGLLILQVPELFVGVSAQL